MFVYGTGIDAFRFVKEYGSNVKIKGFVDTYRFGKSFFGKKIINPAEYVEKYKGIPIIIVTKNYYLEIKKDLEKKGVLFGQEGYIYDPPSLNLGFAIEDLISLNEKRWGQFKIDNNKKNGVVLIPFLNCYYPCAVINAAYAANYYAKETMSSIYAYMRYTQYPEYADDTVKKIYKSLNVTDLIGVHLTETQKKKVELLSKKIWTGIHTWADWNSIIIDGIHFGTSIVRFMMRRFVPSLDARDESLKPILCETIKHIVFWQDFFNNNTVRLVLLADGVGLDSFIREISLNKCIPTYTSGFEYVKQFHDFNYGTMFPYFKKFWDSLSTEEQKVGVNWSKLKLSKRIEGVDNMLEVQCDRNVFASNKHERVLGANDKTKILICPHIFEEDSLLNGYFLFDNNYISWLTHLGELSERTPDYDWYLKMHPAANSRDFMIIDSFLEKYPRIQKIEADVSPIQLKNEGVSVALTIGGTIAYEYPLIGIEVITCGNYPGIAFDFAWNPKTIEEYDSLILNANKLPHKDKIEEIYQFYAIRYLYYDYEAFKIPPMRVCDDPTFYMDVQQLNSKGLDPGTWLYKVYMDECTDERHEAFLKSIPFSFKNADNWKPEIFYKKKISNLDPEVPLQYYV